MDEQDLNEIEDRLEHYSPEARYDILRLTRELRIRMAAGGSSRAFDPGTLYDALTGLLNGGAYGVRFAMARARATRFRKIFAVMSVDVEFDKAATAANPLSDAQRDLTITHVAGRLEASVRATDTLARIGGQNFAVILEDLTHIGHAERVKQIVQESLAKPLIIDGRELAPDISVGIKFYPALHRDSGSPPVYN